jgi:curved DNA-binding protein CbpA
VTIADGDFLRYSEYDLYGLFHVTPDADPQLIQLGYRLAALKAHPDTGGDPQLMQLLNKAKEILLDTKLRAEYDQLLVQRRGRQSES